MWHITFVRVGRGFGAWPPTRPTTSYEYNKGYVSYAVNICIISSSWWWA